MQGALANVSPVWFQPLIPTLILLSDLLTDTAPYPSLGACVSGFSKSVGEDLDCFDGASPTGHFGLEPTVTWLKELLRFADRFEFCKRAVNPCTKARKERGSKGCRFEHARSVNDNARKIRL